jgi:hypothetical protein
MEINGNYIICFLDLRLLIAPLVSSTFSFQHSDINESWKSERLLYYATISNISVISWGEKVACDDMTTIFPFTLCA